MDARYEGPNLSRFLSEDPNFITAGAPDWVTGMPADPTYAGLKGFVNTPSVNYLASPQNLNSYSFVDDNPLRYTDPTGKGLYDSPLFALGGGLVGLSANHIATTFGVSTGLSDRDAFGLGFFGGVGYALSYYSSYGAAAGVGAGSLFNDYINNRPFDYITALGRAISVVALAKFFDFAPNPINPFAQLNDGPVSQFAKFYGGELANSAVQIAQQYGGNRATPIISSGQLIYVQYNYASGGGSVNQLGKAVVNYANTS
jgi:hypothetical protein